MHTFFQFPCRFLAFLMLYLSASANPVWETSLSEAQKKAQRESKDLLLIFTGSDWSAPSQMLSANILSQETFTTLAQKTFTLALFDFPRTPAPDAQVAQAAQKKLVEHYQVTVLPTLVLCDSRGLPYAQVGFQSTTPEAYHKQLLALRALKTTRDAHLQQAAKLTGLPKAQALHRALQSLQGALSPALTQGHYAHLTKELIEHDPQDHTGFQKDRRLEQEIATHMTLIGEHFQNKAPQKVITETDRFLKKNQLGPSIEQKLQLIKVEAYYQLRDLPRALKMLDQISELAPDSEISKQIPAIRQDLTQKMSQPSSP